MKPPELLYELIPEEAKRLHAGYRLMPVEDIEQEMWARYAASPDRFAELCQGDVALARLKLKDAGLRAIRSDKRYRRAVRAAQRGYRTEDEQFYSIRALRAALPMYLDGGIAEHPPRGRDVSPPSHGDAAEGGTYLVIMLDIDTALKAVKPYYRDILERYFAYPQGPGGWTHEEIAGALGIPPDPLRQRVYRALRAVQGQLGGKSPWRRV